MLLFRLRACRRCASGFAGIGWALNAVGRDLERAFFFSLDPTEICALSCLSAASTKSTNVTDNCFWNSDGHRFVSSIMSDTAFIRSALTLANKRFPLAVNHSLFSLL